MQQLQSQVVAWKKHKALCIAAAFDINFLRAHGLRSMTAFE